MDNIDYNYFRKMKRLQENSIYGLNHFYGTTITKDTKITSKKIDKPLTKQQLFDLYTKWCNIGFMQHCLKYGYNDIFDTKIFWQLLSYGYYKDLPEDFIEEYKELLELSPIHKTGFDSKITTIDDIANFYPSCLLSFE